MEMQEKTGGRAMARELKAAHGGAGSEGSALEREYLSGAKKLAAKLEAAASIEVVQDALRGVVGAVRIGMGRTREGETPFDREEVHASIENFFRMAGVPEKYNDDFEIRSLVYGTALDMLMSETLAEVPKLIREK